MFWSPSSGGVRRYLLAKRQWVASNTGWRQTIATPTAEGAGMARVPGVPLPGSGGYRFPLRREVCANCLQALVPDIIEAGDPYRLAWSALDAARRLKIPAVAFCHSNLEGVVARAAATLGATGRRIAVRAALRYVRRLYEQYALVLAPSEAMRQHLLDAGVPRVERQPLGVDTTGFDPALRDDMWRRRWRESLSISEDARVLLYVGRFAPEKNLQTLVDAACRLGPRYVLVAVGAGPTPPQATRQVRVLPYEADRDVLARMLANADVMVHAGDQETFGLAVLESMASGTPIVARAAEGLAELVDGDVGVGVPNLEAAAFADAIASVCEAEADRREQLSRQARERALRHDWSAVFPLLFARYRRLVDAHRRDATMRAQPDLVPTPPSTPSSPA